MKRKELKSLLQGLRNLKSKYYCEFSEKEHFIIDQAIKAIKRMKPKKKWIKTAQKIVRSLASFISKMF